MKTPDNVRHLHPDGQAQGARPEPARITSWTADELMAAKFPEPKWAVPGLIPEGVTLFAGAPKAGTSWASLGLGLSIAAGGHALGSLPVRQAPVLYLALEDPPRRLQERMGELLAGDSAPNALTLTTAFPPLPEGGDAAIAAWLDRNPDARMVVLDVFAKLRGRPAPVRPRMRPTTPPSPA